MQVLLTGSTGFLGRRVVRALLERNIQVRCLVHTPGREEVLEDAPVEVYYGDVTDRAALRAAMYNVDAVVHLVAIIREGRGRSFQRVNVEGTRSVAVASKERDVPRLVHVSVIGARNDPGYLFLHSRWLAEQEVLKSGPRYTILRLPVLFGEGDEFLNALAALVRIFPIVPVPGLGKAAFHLMAVEDAARCIAAAVESEALVEKTIELGGPQRLTYREILQAIARVYGRRLWWCPVPVPLMRLAVWLTDVVLPHPLVTTCQFDMLSVESATELDVVERLFGFQPQRLQEGIQYVRKVSYWDAWRIFLGMMPRKIRDH